MSHSAKRIDNSRTPDYASVTPQDKKEQRVLIGGEALGSLRRQPGKSPVTLQKLVSGITQANRHRELFWGSPQGKEVW